MSSWRNPGARAPATSPKSGCQSTGNISEIAFETFDPMAITQCERKHR